MIGSTAGGDAYATTQLFFEAWTRATTAKKTQALNHATGIVNTLPLLGSKTDPDQTDAFPRDSDTETPQPVEYAVYEIAKALLEGINPQKEIDNLPLSSTAFIGVRKSRDTSIEIPYKQLGLPSPTAYRLLRPYLMDERSIQILRTS